MAARRCPGRMPPAATAVAAPGVPDLDPENAPDVSGLDRTTTSTQSDAADRPTISSDAGPSKPVCVPLGPRDCNSEVDNDCDGQPDNVIDEFCRCTPGAIEGCDEHPGFDGLGLCKAGTRTCFVTGDAGTGLSDWSRCDGAVGPGEVDSCAVAGDDTDCDGLPNEGCACVDGTSQRCGSPTDLGSCTFGTSLCVNGAFNECIGAVAPAPRDSCVRADDSNCNGVPNEGCSCIDGDTRTCGPSAVGICRGGVQTCTNGVFSGECVGAVLARGRDCSSAADNDCDGRPDNTIDGFCQCIPGQGNGPCSGDPENARCDEQGQCRPCQTNGDCSFAVPGGACQTGVCQAPTLPTGATCSEDTQCSSGRCETWFQDRDGDGFGASGDVQRTCGSAGGTSLPPIGYVARSGDCCDLSGSDAVVSRDVFPGQTRFFDLLQTSCPDVATRDYDCSGDIEFVYQEDTARGAGGCEFAGCNGATVWDLAQSGGTPPGCGAVGPILTCAGADGACTGTPGFDVMYCH